MMSPFNLCGHIDVSNSVQQQPLKVGLGCCPVSNFIGKSPEVLSSESVKGAGRDDVKETLPQLFQGFLLTAYLQLCVFKLTTKSN